MWLVAFLINYGGSMHFMAYCRIKLNISDFNRKSYCFNDLCVIYFVRVYYILIANEFTTKEF